jgi:hypothetical protein
VGQVNEEDIEIDEISSKSDPPSLSLDDDYLIDYSDPIDLNKENKDKVIEVIFFFNI